MNNWLAGLAIAISVLAAAVNIGTTIGYMTATNKSIEIYTGRVESQLIEIREEQKIIRDTVIRIDERLNSFDKRVTKLEDKK